MRLKGSGKMKLFLIVGVVMANILYSHVRAVIFDLDGTLVDSEEAHIAALALCTAKAKRRSRC